MFIYLQIGSNSSLKQRHAFEYCGIRINHSLRAMAFLLKGKSGLKATDLRCNTVSLFVIILCSKKTVWSYHNEERTQVSKYINLAYINSNGPGAFEMNMMLFEH